MSNQSPSGLYPIIRRVRRPLLPVDPAPAAPVITPTEVKPETKPSGKSAEEVKPELRSNGAGN